MRADALPMGANPVLKVGGDGCSRGVFGPGLLTCLAMVIVAVCANACRLAANCQLSADGDDNELADKSWIANRLANRFMIMRMVWDWQSVKDWLHGLAYDRRFIVRFVPRRDQWSVPIAHLFQG